MSNITKFSTGRIDLRLPERSSAWAMAQRAGRPRTGGAQGQAIKSSSFKPCRAAEIKVAVDLLFGVAK